LRIEEPFGALFLFTLEKVNAFQSSENDLKCVKIKKIYWVVGYEVFERSFIKL
jgi:hypothetical protein